LQQSGISLDPCGCFLHLLPVVRRLPVIGAYRPTSTSLHAGDEGLVREPARSREAALTDPHGRTYTYLRLSVTDRCDFACVYCMPPGGEEDHATRPDLLTFEEATRVVALFAGLGVTRVRFTGGEPLVRRDVVRLVEMVHRRTGLERLVMTTNGSRLAELARPLRDAGLSGVNVSVDTLDPERFREITRGGELSRVLAGVHAALDVGLEVKVNAVALGGLNAADAPALVDWAWSLGITPRFIELMPLGEASKLPRERFLSQAELIALLGERVDAQAAPQAVPNQGPARYLPARDGSGRRVGFITAVSDEFCASCNRVRVTARGEIRACLASRDAISLRDLMRAGHSDAEIARAIQAALGHKREGHFFEDPAVLEHTRVGMSLVGG
jgi:cyclic pyranopterin phosphate synthase